MRKTLALLMTVALFAGHALASPIDCGKARMLGLKYVQNHASRSVSDLRLAYTQMTESGNAALYVFNFEGGFIIMAADDVAQPILAYGEEGCFDADNMAEGLAYYLRHYARQIEYAVTHNYMADAEITAQWEQLAERGFVNESVRGQLDVQPMLNLKWNQDYPYNYSCPTGLGGPGGRAYAGCVATAMSMVMKYWNWPLQGNGEHSYKPDHYSTQSINFGNTTYDWSNMPVELYAYSPTIQIMAVSTLIYHCGVSVNMNYNYNSSGAFSYDVPDAIANYFRYTNQATRIERDMYSKLDWENMIIASLEEGFPLYYTGSEGDSGHAFVCDGYRASDNKFHFNWGWSGSGNNSYYALDALNVMGNHFNENQTAIFNFIPDYIYNALVSAPTNLTVSAANAHTKTGVVSWTNPTTSLDGTALENIDKVEVTRNGVEIFSQTNVAPGETMTIEDNVSDYDCYTYSVYCYSNNVKGRFAKAKYQYGPTCTWKLVGQTSNFQGWNNGKVQLLNAYGSVVEEITMTSSVPISKQFSVPEGQVSFRWMAPATPINSLTINIKNSSNASVYTFSGPSNNLNGTLFTGDNDCGGCMPPTNLNAEYQWNNDGFGTLLTWDYEGEPQSFKVYRSINGVDYSSIATVAKTEHEYFDNVDAGSYYYKVTAYRSYCESTPAWANEDEDFVHVDVTAVCEDIEGISLYPNPAATMLSIEAEGLQQLTLFNMMGQVVRQQPCSNNGAVLNVADLPSGVYTVRIETANGAFTKQVSVKH